MRRDHLDALICSHPANILLLSGYQPVVGASIALFCASGAVGLVYPEDEKEEADQSWAHRLYDYQLGSLSNLDTPDESAFPRVKQALHDLGITGAARVGIETGVHSRPSSYVSSYAFSHELSRLLEKIDPHLPLLDADSLLVGARSILTPEEQAKLRVACERAGVAFRAVHDRMEPGWSEHDVTIAFAESWRKQSQDEISSDVWSFCMSGPNSAMAYKAFAHTHARKLELGDLVLVHCNSQHLGFWSDITRTYVLGEKSERQKKLFHAVAEAHAAAFAILKPGVQASVVDHAAREVLKQHGFGPEFRHALGHGVGYDGINHLALPRLHPTSPDVLEENMVFNVEPAIYIEGYGGIRHCDVAVTTSSGVEILTEGC
jgi:Xaa-Pro aminopeptidase